MKSRLIIDKLEITFENNDKVQDVLNFKDEIETEHFHLIRNKKDSNYRINFDIYFFDGYKFGNLYYGSYNINRQKIYLMVSNEIFYLNQLNLIISFQTELNLVFNQISRIDLALDCNINVVNKFYKLLKNEDLEIIILNKSYALNENINDILHLSTGTRNNIHKFKSFYIQNKEKGLILNCYDKRKEILDNNNSKSYILNDFNYKNVFRIEVRTNHHLLIDSLNKIGFTDEYLYYIITNSITDELYLLFEHLLNRLFRIKYKKDIYSLIDLL